MKEPVEIEKDISLIAHDIIRKPQERFDIFRSLPLSTRSAVFSSISPILRQQILSNLSFNDAVDLLDHLDLRRLHQVLSRMKDKKRKERLIKRIKNERFEKIDFFLQFHPQASVVLLHLNYVYISEETLVSDTSSIIEEHISNTGKVPVILTSQEGELRGEVPLNLLVKERNNTKLKKLTRAVDSIAYNSDKAEALSRIISKPHQKFVLTDIDGSVLGIIYSDDVIDLMDEQPALSLYNFAGVESSERPFDSIWDKVQGRYRWLIINLFTCFLAAGVVSTFNSVIDQFVVLAIMMPIMAGMSGNAATQTLAITVRGISIGEINLKNSRPAIIKEVLAGAVNGLITSLVFIPIALLLGIGFGFAILGVATIIFGLMLAGFCGTVVPLVLKHFGKDPATSAGIFITTVTDVLTFSFLLGTAAIFWL